MALHWSANVAVLLATPSVASFVGTVVDRVPHREPIFWCRSQCNSCQQTLAVRDLVPIASYLALFGSCRFCKTPIPRRYLVAEVSALFLGGISLAIIGTTNFIVSLPMAWLLFALAYFDLLHGRLPNLLIIALCGLGFAIAPLVAGSLSDRVIGAMLGLLVGASIAGLYRMLRGHDGLGGGDVKLFAAVGAWIGWEFIFVVLLISSVGALLFALATGRITKNATLPFGPFIAAATWAVWCWEISALGGRI